MGTNEGGKPEPMALAAFVMSARLLERMQGSWDGPGGQDREVATFGQFWDEAVETRPHIVEEPDSDMKPFIIGSSV